MIESFSRTNKFVILINLFLENYYRSVMSASVYSPQSSVSDVLHIFLSLLAHSLEHKMALGLTCAPYFLLPFPMTESTHPREQDHFYLTDHLAHRPINPTVLIHPRHTFFALMMNIICLGITSLLFFASVFSDQDRSPIRVFPTGNQSFAGVVQVSYMNDHNQLQYAFNASEARRLCRSLGLSIASKAHVEEALSRGLETCRFGWIDEHFVVIPRIQALPNCGKNQTGLVPWRATVTAKFDVFCFNESDAAAQLDALTDVPLSTRFHSENTSPPSEESNSTLTTESTSSSSSSSSTPKTLNEVESARFVGSTHGSTGAKAVLISCTCGLLFISIVVLVYIKLRRRCSDKQQQKEFVQAEEWTCVRKITETKTAVQEEQRIEVGDSSL